MYIGCSSNRIAWISCVFLFQVSVTAITATILLTKETIEKTDKKQDILLCDTKGCFETAKMFSQNLNLSVDPCDDFYEFACGNFKNNANNATGTLLSRIRRQNTARIYGELKRILNGSFDTRSYPKSVGYMTKFFQLCSNESRTEKIGLRSLEELVKDLGHWKQNVTQSRVANNSSRYLDKMATLLAANTKSLLDIGSYQDPYAPKSFVLYISSPELLENSRDLLTGKTNTSRANTEAYTNFIRATGQLMGAALIKTNAHKIVSLEKDLTDIATPMDTKLMKKITFKSLQNLVPGINWLNLVNKVLAAAQLKDKSLTQKDSLIVKDLQYLKNMNTVLRRYDDDIIEDWMGFQLLKNFIPISTAKFRQIFVDFASKTEEPHADLEDTCYDLMTEQFGLVVGRLYVDKFFTEEVKKECEYLIKDVGKAFLTLLASHVWLDEKTRKEAARKIEHMTINIGFPQFIKDNKELDAEYPFSSVNQDDFVKHLNMISVIIKRREFKNLGEKVDYNKNWAYPPGETNAAQLPAQNSITFPAAILQGILFASDKPASLNYGALGLLAGHEISHAFDTDGIYFASDGSLSDWWTEKSREKFMEKVKCFRNQYSSIKDKVTGLMLNANKTLPDDIADNGALHLAFAAYKNIVIKKQEGLLPGLTRFNHDQLFFLSQANIWCSNHPKKTAEYLMRKDEHSPARYRVNIPLQNSPDFAAAFKCRPGVRMNPGHKCSLW